MLTGHYKSNFIVLTILLSVVSCSMMSKKGDESSPEDQIKFDVEKKVLGNGLTIISVYNPKLPIFSYYTYYRVGSKFERPGITGSSHLLEHMMFKGGKKYGAREFDKLVEGNGGRNNAYTTNDLTVYYESLPSEHFQIVADLEADRMQNLLIEKNSFEKERLVVLEERRMRYENSDKGKIHLKMMKEVFKGTPYGSSVIGEVKDLKTVTRNEVTDYFKTFYTPNNAVIVVVGDIEHSEVFKTISEKFGDISANDELEKTKTKHLGRLGYQFRKDFKKRIKLKGTSPVPMFTMAFKALKLGEKDAYALDILSSVLGDGDSSYLSKEFVTSRRPQLAGIAAMNYTLQDSGVFFIQGQLLEKKSLAKFERNLKRSLRKSCDKAITKRSLQKVQNQYLVSMLSGLDTNEGIARFLGAREVYYGDYQFYQKELDIYRSITLEQVKAVCEKYIRNKENILISIWNKH